MVFVDEELNIKEIQVLDEDNKAMIKMNINNIDFKATFEDGYFSLDSNLETSAFTDSDLEEVSNLSESIFPMYLPTDTYLSAQEVVETTDGQRIILTFEGASPFIIIEESVGIELDPITIPVYGDFDMLTDTVGSIGEKSVSWISDGVEYYVTSDVLAKDELIKIAKSISVLPVMK